MLNWSINPRIRIAAQQLRQGGVVAYPTEAVWGLGCNPFDEMAVARVLELKARPVEKGLIVIAANLTQLEPFIYHLDDLQRQRLKNTWPGPVTWVVPANEMIPYWLSGRFASIALRVTAHPVAAGLCRAFGGPLVSTSCNPQGRNPAHNIHEVRKYFPGELDAITPGQVGKNIKPTEIRDLLTGSVLRSS